MRMPRALAPWLAAAGALAASPAAAQTVCPATGSHVSLAPAWIDDTRGGRAPGLTLSLAACRPDYDTRPRFPRARHLGLRLDGAVPVTELAIPQNLEASAWYGLSVSLSERAPDDPELDLDAAPDAYAFHYGFLGVGARAQYETSADFDEQALAGGAELRWVDPRRPLLPSTVVAWDGVKPLVSGVRDTLGLGSDVHSRLGVRGYWLVPLGRRLRTEIEGGYFWSFGLDDALEARGWDSGPFVAGELAFAVDRPLGPLRLTSLFVGYARGQRPTDGERQRAWTLGAELGVR
ncbi:MAG: hypothetical protein KY453_00575 [Gemmatimonadetes bacterium]|nr:hypothetical protein [Gemmatimonadota bacterium]